MKAGIVLVWILTFWVAMTCFGVALAALFFWWFWEVAILFAVFGVGAMGAHRAITDIMSDSEKKCT